MNFIPTGRRSIAAGFLLLLSPALSSAGTIDFARDVQPILSQNCYACHGPDEEIRKADLRLDVREAAMKMINIDAVDSSELIARITSDDPDELMPPPDKKKHLKPAQIEILRKWIEEGAEWGTHWAFTAPEKAKVPTEETGFEGEIDAFVASRLKSEGLKFSPPAERGKQLRRLSLDLTGLPPTDAELDGFLADKSPDAWNKAVSRMIASPHYGERWARWWMDAARYADSNGYEKDSVRYVWPYRDWLIHSFNDGMPYNDFVIRQIAGDLIDGATVDDKVATGFLRNSMVNEEGAINAEQFRIEGIFDRMDAIGKSILGLTTQCSQCHTHKYDPITHDEYYGMFAYLNNAHEATVAYYPPDERRQIAGIADRCDGIREQAKTSDAGWQARFDKWVEQAKQQIAAEPEWTTVTPELLGDGGQKFYPQPDGSLITMGYSPSRSTEKFAGQTPMKEIRSVRLELLMDPYLTYSGPGRSIEGTAAISELKIFAGTDPDKLEALEFLPAKSDLNRPARPIDSSKYPQKGDKADDRTEGPAAFANDGDLKTAWATENGYGEGGSNQPRLLVMNLSKPLQREGDGPIYLRFEVACQHGGWNSNASEHRNLGKFRFSFSAREYPEHLPASQELREILAKHDQEWSASERQSAFDDWLAQDDALKKFAQQIEVARSEHPQPTPQLVLQEREQPRVTHLFHRGEQTHPEHEVKPHVPAFFHDLPEGDDPESRLTFAKWLVADDSPTTARTFVNRTWQAFFGVGIVESVEDLGHQSPAPSHGELLDWLAADFVEHGWDIQRLHRKIASSDVYRQQSRVTEQLAEVDPRNRLLARGPRFRPDAEVVRDIQLAASGLLDRTVGGNSVKPPVPAFLFLPPVSYGYKTWVVDDAPEKRYRRAMYTFRFRTVPPPFLTAFDAPSGEVSCVRRQQSTTPLQALALLNEPLSVEAAKAMAKSMAASKGDTATTLGKQFRRCTSRVPSEQELSILVNLLEAEKAVGSPDPFLAVARALLSLDETITKE